MANARAGALALLLSLVSRPAAAGEPVPVEYDLSVDATITAVAAATWIVSELQKEKLAPDACRFCAPNRFDAWAREQLLWGEVEPARRASDVLAFGVFPAAVAANAFLSARAAGDASQGWVDLLIVAEAATLAANLNQLVKYTVGRQRPFVHYRNYPEPDRAPDPDDNVSFYSGHTSLAFSLATAAGTVSSMRGYRSAPWVWGIGLGLAAGVGWLRVAGDKHYLTDVLVGAVAGSALGIAVPRWLHGSEEGGAAGITAVPMLGGIAFVF
jgi:membrane-associated phospholipid phosphatase